MVPLRRPLGLKAAFIAALISFSAVLSLIFATVAGVRVTVNLREQMIRRGESQIESMFRDAGRYLAVEDEAEREISLSLLTHQVAFGDTAYAQVVYGGEILSESAFAEGGVALGLLNAPDQRPPLEEIKGPSGRRYLDFVRTFPGAPPQSYVRLGLSLNHVQAEARRTLAVMAGLAFIVTAIGGAVAFGLYSAILSPLEPVIAAIRRFAAGDLSTRAQVTSENELKELADAFNSMAEGIERRNRELEEMNRRLRSANRTKSEFLAMIGHELKTPLHSVRGYCQLLLEELEGPLTPGQRADVEAVLASGNHLLALIENILTFNASGNEALHIRPVQLESILAQAVHQVRAMAQRKGLAVSCDADGAGWIEADDTRLKQVFINLLHNAVTYTHRGGVKVWARRRRGGVLVAVEDTGPGIPPASRKRVFEPFERLEANGSSRTEHRGGLGLGLAIVKRYVKAHGGEVTVGSGRTGGSRFTVWLPQIERTWEVDCADEDLDRRGRSGGPESVGEVSDGQVVRSGGGFERIGSASGDGGA